MHPTKETQQYPPKKQTWVDHFRNALTHNPSDTAAAILDSFNPEGSGSSVRRKSMDPGFNSKKGVNVLQIQKALRAAGYPVHTDGVMGPATRSALQWYKAGKTANNWKPPTGATQYTQHPNGKVTKTSGGASISSTVAGTLGASSGAGKQGNIPGLPSPNVGKLIPEGLANSGAQQYDPSYADSIAGIQYDPQIRETKTMMTRQPLDAAQHLHDIKTWYGDVQKSLKVAAARNASAATDATAQIGNVGRDVLSSIGGGANQGGQTVAAQSAADAAMQAQLGQNEQTYQNDQSPIYANEAAGQLTNQQNKETATAQDLLHQLQDFQGQRGQAKSNAMFQIQGLNNDVRNQNLTNLLGIKNTNNSILQQRYSNALSAQTAAIAAAMNNAQIGYYNASTAAAKTSGGGGFTPWANLNPSQRQQLIQAGVGNVVDSTGALLGKPGQATQTIQQYLLGQGYSGIQHPNVGSGAQMTSMINAALSHAQALLAQRQAAASAAGTTYNGG